MKIVKSYILIILILALAGDKAFAQKLSVSLDRDKIMIGEKILITIKVVDVNPENPILNWINFPDTVNHFEVVEEGKIDTVKVDGMINYQQVINITSFDSGRWSLPSFSVKTNSGIPPGLSTNPITIDVLPVDVSHLKDYHDIKEIVEVKDEKSSLIIIILIIITIIALTLIIWLSRRKSSVIVDVKQPEGNLGALEWALSELRKLRNEQLPSNGLVRQFYQRMTDISRQYFYRELKHSSLHQTTEEWMFVLQDIQVQHEEKNRFFQFLRLADTVKFAKYNPPTEEYEHSLAAAANMFESVAALRYADSRNNHKNENR